MPRVALLRVYAFALNRGRQNSQSPGLGLFHGCCFTFSHSILQMPWESDRRTGKREEDGPEEDGKEAGEETVIRPLENLRRIVTEGGLPPSLFFGAANERSCAAGGE